MRKSWETTHSFFHDPDFENASFLLLTESYISFNAKSHLLSVFLFYTRWQPFYPSQVIQRIPDQMAPTPFYPMIQAAKGQKTQQVLIYYPDIIALLLFYLERSILVISVYILCCTSNSQDKPKLVIRLYHIYKIYKKMQYIILELKCVVNKDFNCWDMV